MKLKDFIEQKIRKIESGGNLMEVNKNLKVELKERLSLLVISTRITTSMSNISSVIGNLFEDVFKLNLQPEGHVMTVYHDKKEFDVENADCEICIPINKNVSMEKSNKIKEFPGGLVACTTFIGPYSKLGQAYAEVMKWINANGYENAGAPYDIYLIGPQSVESPEQYVTEVCFPVNKK